MINRIDHIPIHFRLNNSLQDVQTRGTDSDSNHFFVKGKIKIKLKNPKWSTGTMMNGHDVSKVEAKEMSLFWKTD